MRLNYARKNGACAAYAYPIIWYAVRHTPFNSPPSVAPILFIHLPVGNLFHSQFLFFFISSFLSFLFYNCIYAKIMKPQMALLSFMLNEAALTWHGCCCTETAPVVMNW